MRGRLYIKISLDEFLLISYKKFVSENFKIIWKLECGSFKGSSRLNKKVEV
jgi:hypothetical protein